MMNTLPDRLALMVSASAALMVLIVPATAQEIRQPEVAEDAADIDQAETQNEGLQRSARTADTGIGEVGQRQTARDGPGVQEPLGRITSRINNRVENRIRNRIDRNYDPTANATSPFEISDRRNRAGQGRPR